MPVPWARERSGFTLLFEAMVVTLAGMSRMPVRQIAKLLGGQRSAVVAYARRAGRDRLRAFQTHIDGIRNTLTHTNSNAPAESINADVQSAIARARGFRTFRNLRTIVYLLKGRLDLPSSPFTPAVA